jgi:uncharacterized membrane protein YjjB (DUF3815 family)
MPEWLDPRAIGLLVFLAILSLLFGAVRRDPPLAIAASTCGIVIAWVGLMWAGDVGQEAVGALLVATIGLFLMIHGNDRAKAAKAARALEERGSTDHPA